MKPHLLSFCAFSLLALSACEQNTPNQQTENAYRVNAAVAAWVNGEPIYIPDVELEAASQGLVQNGEPLSPEDPVFDEILEQLIDQKLLSQEALRRGLEYDEVARHRLQAARERILGNILVESLVAEEVDENAIRKMYEEQVKLQELGEEVLIRHILVDTREKADEVVGELRSGSDFEKLAYDYSIDRETFLEGGRIGYVVPEEMPRNFAQQIRSTAIGAISAPFQTEMGWHIVRVDDRRDEKPETFEEMRPKVVRFLTLTEISRTLKQLRARADIAKESGAQIGHHDVTTETEPNRSSGNAGSTDDSGARNSGDGLQVIEQINPNK